MTPVILSCDFVLGDSVTNGGVLRHCSEQRTDWLPPTYAAAYASRRNQTGRRLPDRHPATRACPDIRKPARPNPLSQITARNRTPRMSWDTQLDACPLHRANFRRNDESCMPPHTRHDKSSYASPISRPAGLVICLHKYVRTYATCRTFLPAADSRQRQPACVCPGIRTPSIIRTATSSPANREASSFVQAVLVRCDSTTGPKEH